MLAVAAPFSHAADRQVDNDNVLISTAEPRLAFWVEKDFDFVGRHPISIGDVARGERFVFCACTADSNRFLIVQFEAFLPDVEDEYRYDMSGRPVIAGYRFRSNGFAFDVRESLAENPGGEAAASFRFLTERGIDVPDVWLMWRSLAVTDSQRRSEVIIFYVEDAETHSVGLEDLYAEDSVADRWITLQQQLEDRASEAYSLSGLDSIGSPDESSRERVPATVIDTYLKARE